MLTRVDATYRVLSAAVRIHPSEFTLADLAQRSTVRPNTVRTVVRRHLDWFEFCRYQPSDRRGGRARLLRIREDRLDAVLTRLRPEEVGLDNQEPLGVRLAFHRIVNDLPRTVEPPDRSTLVRAIKRHLEEDVQRDSSVGAACRRAAQYLLDASEPESALAPGMWRKGRILSEELAKLADMPGRENLHCYRAEVLQRAGDIRLVAALMPMMVAAMDAAAVYSMTGEIPRGKMNDGLSTLGVSSDLANFVTETVRSIAVTSTALANTRIGLSTDTVRQLTRVTGARNLVVRMTRCSSSLAVDVYEQCSRAYEQVDLIDNADLKLGRRTLGSSYDGGAVYLYESVSLIRRDFPELLLREYGDVGGSLPGAVERYVLVEEDATLDNIEALLGFRPLRGHVSEPEPISVESGRCWSVETDHDVDNEFASQHALGRRS